VNVKPVSDLVEFLQARYDELEQLAKAANVKQDDPEWWCSPVVLAGPGVVTVRSRRDNRPMARVESVSGDEYADVADGTAVAVHIALHDPAYVLADIASKRAIVDLHASDGGHECPGWARRAR
jgi:hypothetical protein